MERRVGRVCVCDGWSEGAQRQADGMGHTYTHTDTHTHTHTHTHAHTDTHMRVSACALCCTPFALAIFGYSLKHTGSRPQCGRHWSKARITSKARCNIWGGWWKKERHASLHRHKQTQTHSCCLCCVLCAGTYEHTAHLTHFHLRVLCCVPHFFFF